MSLSVVHSFFLKMAQLVRSPSKAKGSRETEGPEEESETPVSTLSSNPPGSDKGYYGDDEPSSYDGDVEVLLIEEEGREGVQSDRKGIMPVRSSLFRGASSLSTRAKFLFGLFIVFVIAMSWVGSTQMGKSAFAGNFKAPFFLIWFSTSWMIVIFPVSIPFYFVTTCKWPSRSSFGDLWRHSREIINPPDTSAVTFLTSTVLFTLLWMPTNYLYARALITMAPTDVTALFSTAPAFVFLFSMPLLREPPLILRFFAVVLAVSGIVLFSYEEGFGSANTVGIVLSVGSAIGAALYKTLLKWRVKEASLYQMSLFLTSIGIFSTVVFWPILIVLHASGVEVIHDVHWGFISAHAILGVIFNFAINFGIAFTFPLFISLGTILGIPINAFFDVLFRDVDLANWKITAIDLIVGGFLLILVSPDSSEWIHRTICALFKKCCHKFTSTR